MTIRALIAEDEPILAATLAQSLLRLWPELDIVATCPNGVDALEKALALQPQVLFLDIKMPGMTGLDVVEELAERWSGPAFPHIVFVTAFGDFALEAFERDAADYVTKPINDARLAKTVSRLQQRLGANGEGGQFAHMLEQMRALMPVAPQAEKLAIIRASVGNEVRMIPIDKVVYFEAADKYINVVTLEGDVLIRTSLRELLPQLDERQFWQVHRGTIVNASCIQSALRDEAGKLSLVLRGRREQLRVSPLYAHLFRQM
jgi:DNA-binding LytR/AlgR family response regulator